MLGQIDLTQTVSQQPSARSRDLVVILRPERKDGAANARQAGAQPKDQPLQIAELPRAETAVHLRIGRELTGTALSRSL